MLLDGKIAIVSGASRGIGRAIAISLGEAGADVVINYHSNSQAAEEVADKVRSFGRQAVICQADVSSHDEAAKLVKTCINEFGRLDILVNNAGITRDNLVMRMKEEDWDRVLEVNLKGAFNLTKAAARYLLKSDAGRVINISSIIGLRGNPGQCNYAAAKAGLVGFTKALARELGSRRVTVNAVAPGFIVTEMTQNLRDDIKEKMLADIPLGRFGQAEEVAALVRFLAGDAAGYITGQVIAVDGGLAI
ncbi:MAG: 3-oxoacyl-[acyl-carrier-protein] reductase [Peptococcaceae bacterium]|nr:3-oxoacyl-[acyl-carrier-protein] reductase [Peptococcaceae bacterium]